MFDRLDQLEARYEDLGRQMSDPTLVNDQKKFQSIAKQHRDMEPTVEKFREYRKIKDGIAEAKVHAEDFGYEERGLVAAGAGAEFEDDVLLVVGVFGEQEDFEFFFDFGEAGLEG